MMTIVARELNKIRNNAITSFARGVAMLLTTTIIISLAVLQFEVLCLFNIESATADCIDLTEKATQSYIIHMRRVKLLLYVIFFKSSILLMAVSRLRFVNCNILEVDLLENCAIDVPFMASFIIAYFFYYAPLMIGWKVFVYDWNLFCVSTAILVLMLVILILFTKKLKKKEYIPKLLFFFLFFVMLGTIIYLVAKGIFIICFIKLSSGYYEFIDVSINLIYFDDVRISWDFNFNYIWDINQIDKSFFLITDSIESSVSAKSEITKEAYDLNWRFAFWLVEIAIKKLYGDRSFLIRDYFSTHLELVFLLAIHIFSILRYFSKLHNKNY